jgi:hypothetical protein
MTHTQKKWPDAIDLCRAVKIARWSLRSVYLSGTGEIDQRRRTSEATQKQQKTSKCLLCKSQAKKATRLSGFIFNAWSGKQDRHWIDYSLIYIYFILLRQYKNT